MILDHLPLGFLSFETKAIIEGLAVIAALPFMNRLFLYFSTILTMGSVEFAKTNAKGVSPKLVRAIATLGFLVIGAVSYHYLLGLAIEAGKVVLNATIYAMPSHSEAASTGSFIAAALSIAAILGSLHLVYWRQVVHPT